MNAPAMRPVAAGVAFGALVSVLAAYHQFKLPPVLPVLIELYGHDARLAGGFMSVYALAGLLLSPLLGRFIERDGVPRYLFAGFALLAAGCAIGLVLPGSGMAMLLARGLEGAGFAALAIVGPVLVARHAGPAHAALATGLVATWIPSGQLLANAIARFAVAADGWRLLWWVGLAATAAMALWTARRAAAGVDAGLAVAGRGAATAATGGSRPLLWLSAAVFCLWSMQYFAYMTWLPTFLVTVHGLAPDSAVAGYTVPVAVLIVFNLVTGWLLKRGVPVAPLLAGALAGQAAVWAALPVTGGGWPGLLSLIAYGIGAGIAPTCLFGLPRAIEGGGRAGAFATLMTGRNLGVLAGPLLLAWLLDATGGWTAAGPVFAVTTATALLVSLWLAVRLARRRQPAMD
ncbi:MAG: MFS transporter [Inquilinus sp.]|nr:MFS transporter [Inquilinus sp.]